MRLSVDRDVSEEILDEIVSCCSQQTRLALSLTSKKLNRIAAPYLYCTLRLQNDVLNANHLFRLLYLLSTSPAYASLIRELVILPDEWDESSSRGDSHSGVTELWPEESKLEEAIKATCSQYSSEDDETMEMYEKVVVDKDEDVILTLLLTLLPSLKKLDLNLQEFQEYPYMTTMLERVGRLQEPLEQNLLGQDERLSPASSLSQSMGLMQTTNVSIKSNSDKYPNNTAHLAPFFNLPSLRSIYAWKYGNEDGASNEKHAAFAGLMPRSCPVNLIELRCSKLHKENFEILMDTTIPGMLKTLIYEIGCTWAWCNVEHPAIIEALGAHQSSLENLSLSHEDYYPYEVDSPDDDPSPISLASFTALRRIKVAPVFIFGHINMAQESGFQSPTTINLLWQCLPQTLTQLWINRAVGLTNQSREHEPTKFFEPDCLIPALEGVVAHKSISFPNLSEIRLEFPLQQWQREWLVLLQSLNRLARTQGIALTVILDDVDVPGQDEAEIGWGWDEDVMCEPCFANQASPKIWLTAAEDEDISAKLDALWLRNAQTFWQ